MNSGTNPIYSLPPDRGLLDLPGSPLTVTPRPPSLKAAVLTRRSLKHFISVYI